MSDQFPHFREQESPLTKRGEEGLRLLQHAWNEYDVAKYHGHWYTIISIVLTFSFLALGFVTIIFIVIDCGEMSSSGNSTSSGDGSENECLPGRNRLIFGLTLLVTFVVALDECIKPAQKAMHLKPAAEKLKSWIWLYRWPAGTHT